MNEFREIVAKAVVSKGRKVLYQPCQIVTNRKPYSILGCWIINHSFEVISKVDGVDIDGSFEVNIWYSLENNTKTDIIREVIRYKKDIKTKRIVKEYLEDSEEILAKVLEHPNATSVRIVDNKIELDVTFEILVEVIGETKMQVTIFNPIPTLEEEIDELDIDINEDFLKEK